MDRQMDKRHLNVHKWMNGRVSWLVVDTLRNQLIDG